VQFRKMPPNDRRGRGNARSDKMTPTDPLTPQQTAVAKWLRHNVPTKKTKFMHSHTVEFFVGSKAVDMLMEDSPFSEKKVKNPETDFHFKFREQAIEFCDELLKHKMFHRAKKIQVDDKFKKKSKKAKTDNTEGENTAEENKDNKAVEKSDKKKRKIRLDMHLEQLFLDGKEVYVWIYDPTPWYYWVGGGAIVLITIAICLFPLWPPWMRLGVHYLSIGAAGFLVAIIALAIIKYIIFGLVFLLSAGKLKFWIFPNLTEDVGFFESFLPIYDYTYTGPQKKDKDSDDEESDDEEDRNDDKNDADQSESDDSTSKKSSVTGKDFEMVDHKEETD